MRWDREPEPRTPKGAGALVLYLDFDGVLHHENVYWKAGRGAVIDAFKEYTLFQYAPLLDEILAPYPEVKIVLSTSWVRWYGFDKAAKRLPPGLRNRCIGATFHSGMNEYEFLLASRGMQVWGDVYRRKPLDWLALDDDYLHWPAWCLDKYVRTHDTLGFTAPVPLMQLKVGLQRMVNSQLNQALGKQT